jgi:hypothetical protein
LIISDWKYAAIFLWKPGDEKQRQVRHLRVFSFEKVFDHADNLWAYFGVCHLTHVHTCPAQKKGMMESLRMYEAIKLFPRYAELILRIII